MITSVIIEDEPLSLKRIADMIKRFCPLIRITGTAGDMPEAFQQIHKLRPQLIFLDIELAGQNSLKLFEQLKYADFEVIFVTAHDQYGIQAVKHNAVDYVLKPIDKMEFLSAVEKAIKRIEIKTAASSSNATTDQNKLFSGRLAIPTIEGLVFVDLDKIIYCESEGRYTSFHFVDDNKKLLVSKNLGEYETILPPERFIRIHHHSIVNVKHVEKYIKGRGGYVIMKDGRQLAVSTRKKDFFLDSFG